ncbi:MULTISPECIES: EAL domain-containing protein [Paenibacillus]|uniref:EAL domain-containing protein n=1 Tax=Paenibacillus TaxID=44249 RepID=UPI001F374577|nr:MULTISPECIES: EAL domain-containing protein [Paenibacillus]
MKVRSAIPCLENAVQGAGFHCDVINGSEYVIPYRSRDEILSIIKLLEERDEAGSIAVCLKGRHQHELIERWVSLSQLRVRIVNHGLIDVIINKEFCSYMQPIVNSAEHIIGFEFLLRPIPGGHCFRPYTLFEVARESGYHSFLDRAALASAIESSRILPDGMKRFINFLPSSISNPKYCLAHAFEAISAGGLRPEDFVFEVVETEMIRNIGHLAAIFSEYRHHGVHVALDDVGSGFATLEVMEQLRPDYVKIDRDFVSLCDTDLRKQETIREIVEKSGRFGGRVLAEGIERREEFEFCLGLGIELAQGYFFGRPMPEPPPRFSAI